MKSKNKIQYQIILASGSPRRADLLRQLGLDFKILLPEIDETPLRGEGPKALVRRLSRQKAQALEQVALSSAVGPIVMIAADTIVVAPNGKSILGKPTSVVHAKKMLKALSGKTHTVFTGYTLHLVSASHKRKTLTRVVKSQVKLLPLSAGLIDRYLQSGEPFDKAGSYGAQGIGASLIEKINGSYTNVVGLPVSHLSVDLEALTGMRRLEWNQKRDVQD